MSGIRSRRASSFRKSAGSSTWLRFLKGLGAAVLTSIAGIAIFALVMQWVRPSEDAVRVINQLLKLLSVAVGTWVAVGRGQEGGLLKGAAVGVGYMVLGVAAYVLLGGQSAPWTAYLADLAMGAAAGGLIGGIVSNLG